MAFTVPAVLIELVEPCVMDVWRTLFLQPTETQALPLFDRFLAAATRNGTSANSSIVFIYRDEFDIVRSRVLLRSTPPHCAWGVYVQCPARCDPQALIAVSNKGNKQKRKTAHCSHCHRKWVITRPSWIFSVSEDQKERWFWAEYPLKYPEWPQLKDVQREIL